MQNHWPFNYIRCCWGTLSCTGTIQADILFPVNVSMGVLHVLLLADSWVPFTQMCSLAIHAPGVGYVPLWAVGDKKRMGPVKFDETLSLNVHASLTIHPHSTWQPTDNPPRSQFGRREPMGTFFCQAITTVGRTRDSTESLLELHFFTLDKRYLTLWYL